MGFSLSAYFVTKDMMVIEKLLEGRVLIFIIYFDR